MAAGRLGYESDVSSCLTQLFPILQYRGTINYVTADLHNRKKLNFTITLVSFARTANYTSRILVFGGKKRKTKDS